MGKPCWGCALLLSTGVPCTCACDAAHHRWQPQQAMPHLLPPRPALSAAQMGETPLIRCAHNGHFQTVKFLVEQGADVNAVDMVRGAVPLPDRTGLVLSNSAKQG